MTTNTVATAKDFVSSIGINTHAGFGTGAYLNSSLVLKSLNYIGVDLVRDAFVSFGAAAPVVEALAAGGVKFDFVVSSLLPGRGPEALADFVKGLQALEQKHPGSVFAVEGLNEANIRDFSYKGSSTMEAAGAFQKALYEAIKSNATLAGKPVVNVSLGNDDMAAYKALGDLGKYSDYANAHTYTHTRGSADATMEAQIAPALKASGGDPLMITETGYSTLESHNYLGTSETAQAKLLLDNLLNAYENGSSKTFLYELFDGSSDKSNKDSEMHFGIFRDDGTPKLAATALHNLTTILNHEDEGTGGTGAAGVKFSGLPSGSHTMTLSKANGVYDVVVWTDALVWDDKADKDIVNKATDVTVQLGGKQASVYVYDPLQSQAPIAVYKDVSEIKLPLSDSPLIIEVGAAAPIAKPVADALSGPDLKMTSAEFVASIDTLMAAGGLKSVTLTDGPTLKVSSVATMQHMIDKDAAVLAKIKGGFNFTVDYGQAAWRKVTNYDAKGTVQSTTDYSLKDGVVLSKTTVNADGSRFSISYKNDQPTISRELTKDGTNITSNYDAAGKLINTLSETRGGDKITVVYTNGVKTAATLVHGDGSKEYHAFNLTGRSYTNQVQIVDAKGSVISVTRTHADGSLDYKEVYDGKGGKTLSYYDAKGAKLTDAITKPDGSKEVLSFDAGTGKLMKSVATAVNGTVVTKNLANGAPVSESAQSADGSKNSFSVVTPDGKLKVDTKILADGSKSETQYLDGVKKAVTITHTDGALENYAYGITGKPYATQHQIFDKAGNIQVLERIRADGTMESSENHKADGSKLFTTFNTAGKAQTVVSVGADGGRTTLTYETSGALAKEHIQLANGEVKTTSYAAGVKTAMTHQHADGSVEQYAYNLTGRSYTTQHQSVDANGKVVSLVRSHADGSLDYSETYGKDGSKVMSVYDAKGTLLTVTNVGADGSRYVDTYLQDGSKAVRHDMFNGAKVLQFTDIQNADGTHSIWAQADNQVLTGSAGNDKFYLFANNETVRFTGGHDTIYSFDVSRPDVDRIVVSKTIADHFSDLHLKQVGGDVLVQIDAGNSILVVGTQTAQLTSDFFTFA